MPFSRPNLHVARSGSRRIKSGLFACLFPFLVGCTTVPLEQANTLGSYEGLSSGDGLTRKAKFQVQAEGLLLVKTVYIEPTIVSQVAMQNTQKSSDRALVTTAIDRALCVGVSDRFTVVDSRESADLAIHATITRIVPTNASIAGLSTAISLGSSAVIPGGVPRLPMGLGGLSVEAEATARDGRQLAAMVWARGANSLTTNARVSPVGDAYSLGDSFGNAFSKMLTTGKTPFKGFPKLPSSQRLRSDFGGKPKYQACERFGRAPGIGGLVAGKLGLPPSWTDHGAPETRKLEPTATN